ncbi:MAG: AI-2E family transporter [bacterium]
MRDNNPNKFLNAVAAIFLIGFLVFVLKELQSILLPLFIAVIISFVFLPFYNLMIRKKFPAAVAVIIVVICIILISNISSLFILTSINSFSSEFPKYETKFLQIYDDMITKFNLSSVEVENINKSLDVKKLLADGSLTSTITMIFTSITGLLGNYILIIFYVIFILSESKNIRQRISVAFPDKHQAALNTTLTGIFSGVKDYIAGKTLLSLIQAVFFGIFLWICGVDFFIIWGFMFFFSDFIPNIGSMLVTILVAITTLLQFESLTMPIIIVAVLIIVQNLKGNILEPRIFGQRLDLSPLLLFFSLIFWGYIWGVIGMILSVPIMSMIKITFMNIPATKPIAILMSNNALPPVKKNKKI